MYEFFTILLFSINIILIILIILTPSKNNIIGLSINVNNKFDTVITSNFLKKTLNNTIIVVTLIFYLICLILNLINNNKINKINNFKYIKNNKILFNK